MVAYDQPWSVTRLRCHAYCVALTSSLRQYGNGNCGARRRSGELIDVQPVLPSWPRALTSMVMMGASLSVQETHEAVEPTEESHDPQFEPVVRLTEQVEAKTHEEDEEIKFKMYVAAPLPLLCSFGQPLTPGERSCSASTSPSSSGKSGEQAIFGYSPIRTARKSDWSCDEIRP